MRRRAWLAAALLLLACAERAPQPEPEAWVVIRNERVAAETADTAEEQIRGLGLRDELPWGEGMLFEYERPGFYSFWMKDMRFDIDIVWLLRGRIVHIVHGARHDVEGPLPSYRPPQMADTVLEVPAGFAQVHGWQSGDRAEITRPRG